MFVLTFKRNPHIKLLDTCIIPIITTRQLKIYSFLSKPLYLNNPFKRGGIKKKFAYLKEVSWSAGNIKFPTFLSVCSFGCILICYVSVSVCVPQPHVIVPSHSRNIDDVMTIRNGAVIKYLFTRHFPHRITKKKIIKKKN